MGESSISYLTSQYVREIISDGNELQPASSSVRGIPQVRILAWVTVPSFKDLPNSEIEPRSPALQVDSLQVVSL